MADLKSFDAEKALGRLKNFQRQTVNYVVRRFYKDAHPTRRFLVADEVGLGKTMVARGVIAGAIEHLRDTGIRIDVIYICSNQAIASQNINRLNVFDEDAVALPTRMTLLPLQLAGEHGLGRNDVNFISLTPGTTFNLRSSTGVVQERALLYHLLKNMVEPRRGLYNLLRVGAGVESWERAVNDIAFGDVDEKLIGDFQQECSNDQGLLVKLGDLCRRFHRRRNQYPWDMTTPRNEIIGDLRNRLARVCVDALEPDLVILDEFQRFTELLKGDHDAAKLAQELFDYTDRDGNAARTLLLSATPYRMLTLSSDSAEEGKHYTEFLETLEFLYGRARGREVAQELEQEIDRFRRALLSLPEKKEEAQHRRSSIERRLKSVIARTERVSSTTERDAMVKEPKLLARVEPTDLRSAVSVSAVARVLKAPDTVEYWKSAPYLLNFMRDYALKRALRAAQDTNPSPDLLDAVKAARSWGLNRAGIKAYRPLTPPNGRMRVLMDDVFGSGLDRHLWIGPALPYYCDGETNEARNTKALVFSSWSMVPDAIAGILSYEAERRMGVKQAGMGYFDRDRPRPLQFGLEKGRLSGLRTLLLFCPLPLLAERADPLDIVSNHSGLLTYEEMRAKLAERLQPTLEQLQFNTDRTAPSSNWEWAGPVLLEALSENRFRTWLESDDAFAYPGKETAWSAHVDALKQVVVKKRIDGEVPDHALELLVDLALGSPAICALRALRRVASTLDWDDPTLLTAASRVAWGFRTLFNQHDTVALLRRDSEARYWHNAIAYAARNNLQAVLDEYVHVLVESEGLRDAEAGHRVTKLSESIARVLSLLPSQIEVDDPQVRSGRLRLKKFTLRGRFAMRLADYRDEEGEAARLSGVRDAFNSPFRPFVLATTSIGQEGLDFHPYCYRLYHWNLPGNPVDLEQREGRVHRYKGHAIRLNVAHKHAMIVRGSGSTPADPWEAMFEDARTASPINNDLIPYWIFDGPTKVERRVPLLPYSREMARLEWLKKSVAVYRLAFGQPRQDDLLSYLTDVEKVMSSEELEALQIRLVPSSA